MVYGIRRKSPKFQIPSHRKYNIGCSLELWAWNFGLGTFLFLIALCLTPYPSFSQQDPQYSQYMFNQLILNPAYAGSRDVLAVSFSTRKQWFGIPGSPFTNSISVQMPLRKKKIGIGAEIFNDKIGPRNTTALLLSYSYRIRLGKGKLSFGLRTGLYDYVFKWNEMNYQHPNDVYYINNTDTRTAKFTSTVDFGMYYYARTFYWGIACNHLNKGKITEISINDSSARQAVHWFMPMGKAIQAGSTVINPVILVKATAGAPAQADIGINFLLKEQFWIGVATRSGYGLMLLMQCRIKDKMKVGISLDHGINRIGALGKGTLELMIGYDMPVKGTKMMMPRFL